MSRRIKTTISTNNSIFDINGQWLPKGNYYFCIDEFTSTTAKGELFERTFRAEYEFSLNDLVKMMSTAQARLARRANITNENMPTSASPTLSPVSRPTGMNFDRIRNYVDYRDTNYNSENIETTSRRITGNSSDNTSMCTICLELIGRNDNKTLGCNHCFHKICINRWLSTNTNCPVCRRFVMERDSRSPVISNTYLPQRSQRTNNVRVAPIRLRTRQTNLNTTSLVLDRFRRPVSRNRQREYNRVYASGSRFIT